MNLTVLHNDTLTMSTLHNAIREFSGQKNCVVIQRPYIRMTSGDYMLAAVLSQLVFLSGCTKRTDGWFYKKYDDLADELSITPDQARYAVSKLKKKFPTIVFTKVKKADGNPTVHYRVDGDELIKAMFSQAGNSNDGVGNDALNVNSTISSNNSELASDLPNGKFTESKCKDSDFDIGKTPEQNGEITKSLVLGTVPESITDLNTDIKKIRSIPLTPKGADVSQQVSDLIDHLNQNLVKLASKLGKPAPTMGFRAGTASARMISARLREGYTMDDCRMVLDYLSEMWGADVEMREHLCPTTIFRPSKFEDRVVKAHNWNDACRPSRAGNSWDRNAPSAFNLSDALDDTTWADNGLGL